MPTKHRKYNPDQDFIHIRDFLANTFKLSDKPNNWRIERWNYPRYFVAPMLGDPDPEQSRINIRFWENTNGVWENELGEIVGVVTCEHPDPSHPGFGEAFIQRHPDYDNLLTEMLEYAEATFPNKENNSLSVFIYNHDQQFQLLASDLGYKKNSKHPAIDSLFTIQGEIPEIQLPVGYELQSMQDQNNLEVRCKIFGLSFNHPDPKDWPSVQTYIELQKAPDYRKALDLFVSAPNGDYVSCCIMWYDQVNNIGVLEPVGTHPDYRRMGFGKAVVQESIRRAANLGANRIWVGSGQSFYEALGFQKKITAYPWTKQF